MNGDLWGFDEIPCASVLKPIYAYLSYPKYLYKNEWYSLAREAIVMSDNKATDEMVAKNGGLDKLTEQLNWLARQGGGSNVVFKETPETWGRYKVSHDSLKFLYKGLMLAIPGDDRQEQIYDMMSVIDSSMRFGLPTYAPVKTGWDLVSLGGQKYFSTLGVLLNPNQIKVETFMSLTPVSSQINIAEWKRLTSGGSFNKKLNNFHSLK